jgi:nucleotide-binding universal stress UspA family protein
MATTYRAGVVVGVDGSESSLEAVRLAAREAALRHSPLHVVHAFVWALMNVPLGPHPLGPPDGGLRNEAERLVKAALEEAETAAPGVPVTSEIIDAAAAPVLVAQAQDARMVVVGNRGLGGFSGLIMGSVAVQLTSHAACPVVVVRGEARSGTFIAVGVDGSEVSNHAVAFAFEEASLRGVPLAVVHAWHFPVSTGPGDMLPLVYDQEELAADEERFATEATAGWSERYPDVEVIRRIHRGHPAKALVEESDRAELVVVGSRGRGGFTGLLLGSVSQAVLHHSHCPVAIVHQ